MRLINQISTRIRQALGPALLVLALGYFAYHAVEGKNGLLALLDLNAEMAELEATASEFHTEKEMLERKVSSLRRDNLDLDLLDERARAVLGFQEEGEIVIYTDPEE